MIGVVATLKVQPDKASDFEKVFLDLAAKVKANESGCLMYQLTKSKTEAGVYKVLELYASTDALKAHGGTDYFKAAHPDTDWETCLEHAEKLGLGSRQYELVKI